MGRAAPARGERRRRTEERDGANAGHDAQRAPPESARTASDAAPHGRAEEGGGSLHRVERKGRQTADERTRIHTTNFPRVKKAGHTDGRAPPMRVSAIDMSAQYAIDMSARGAIDSYA